MTPVTLLVPPPLGPAACEPLARELGAEVLDPWTLGRPDDLVDRLARRLSGDVVGWGLAAPLVGALPGRPGRLRFVSNGPLLAPDPLTRVLAALPAPLLREALRGSLPARWLASSLGGRRLVGDPYVMTAERARGLVHPLLHRREVAAAVAAWILAVGSRRVPLRQGDDLVVAWGTGDRLHGLVGPHGRWRGVLVELPGARALHPIERPRLLAGVVEDRLRVRGEADRHGKGGP